MVGFDICSDELNTEPWLPYGISSSYSTRQFKQMPSVLLSVVIRLSVMVANVHNAFTLIIILLLTCVSHVTFLVVNVMMRYATDVEQLVVIMNVHLQIVLHIVPLVIT